MTTSLHATSPSAPKKPSSGSKAKPKAPKAASPTPDPEQMDRFTRETDLQQQFNFENEHRARLETQKSLSAAKIAAMRAELQTQLFSLWNDVWLQRQKTNNEAFKSWLKLLSS